MVDPGRCDSAPDNPVNVMGLPRLTPQERIRLAKSLRKQAAQPGLKIKQRQEKRRHAANLMQLNLIEANRKKPD